MESRRPQVILPVVKLRIAVLLVVTILVGACAAPSGPPFVPVEAISPEKALLYVYRLKRFAGAGNSPYILVNGAPLTQLRNGSYSYVEVDPGLVSLATSERYSPLVDTFGALTALSKKANERLRLDVEAGKVYFIRWNPRRTMELRDETVGAREIADLYLSTE